MSNININNIWRSNNINKISNNNNYIRKISSSRSFIGIIIGNTISNMNIRSCSCICNIIMSNTGSSNNNIVNAFDKVSAR